MTRPNLLLITSDQQHWRTLGAINNPKIKTPNLDRLAKMGVHFARAYCPNPTCTPTRASIITGMYPSYHGAWTLGTKLPQEVPTLGEYLKKSGYWSALIGKAHFQPLKNTPDCHSIESYPILRDLDFWREFNGTGTPWYGFDHVETCRNHAHEGHAGQHYAIWLEEQGLKDWKEYFGPRNDQVPDGQNSKAPLKDAFYGGVASEPWQLPEHLHYTTWTGLRTIAAIEQAHAANQPFFIWSSYHDPHPPYTVSEPWASMYDPAEVDIGAFVEGEFDQMSPPFAMTREAKPSFASFNRDGRGNHGYHSHLHDEQALRKAVALYYGMISFMDHWIGQTLDKLEALGELDNTLIVFTSDHGHFVGQHGLIAKGPFHYEDVIRVPFIAAWQGTIEARKEDRNLQSLVDIAPTFLAAAGIETPLAMQGVSQLEAWKTGKDPRRDHAIVENHHNRASVHLRTLVTQRYKLTVYRDHPDWGELFDLQDDPDELKNLFADPAQAEIKTEMLMRLIQADLSREPAPTPRVSGA